MPKKEDGAILLVLIILLVLLSFVGFFVAGFYVAKHADQIPLIANKEDGSKGSISEKAFKPVASESAQIATESAKKQIQIDTSGENIAQETTTIVPGKKYYEESVMMMTKTEPYITFIATVVRLEQDIGFTQNTRISFYDGTGWKRDSESRHLNDSTIIGGKLINSWEVSIDPSRVLKEGTNGKAVIDNHEVVFRTGELRNEISMRSLPGYTKFMSKGDGFLSIDGKSYAVNEIYTKIYSLNSADIQFYSEPLPVTTDWIVFWDKDGNIYHLDMTDVPNPTPVYQSHTIGFRESNNSVIAKTMKAQVERDQNTPPQKYTVTFGSPVSETLRADLQNALNKSLRSDSPWYMGQIKGTITKEDGSTVEGVGIVEYIHH